MLASCFVLVSSLLTPQIGGTGADGPLFVDPQRGASLDTTNGGLFNFTTITINGSLSIHGRYPAILRSQGDVIVSQNGRISSAGESFRGSMTWAGAGGWIGGWMAVRFPWTGQNGEGPGGGQGGVSWNPFGGAPYEGGGSGSHATLGQFSNPGCAPAGPLYGSVFPFSLEGGSGGGGGAVYEIQLGGFFPWGGASGGGAVAIIADGAIRFDGRCDTSGGGDTTLGVAHGGAGSGGAILLRSRQEVIVGPTAQLLSVGGTVEWQKLGGDGFIRIDSFAADPIIQGVIDPAPLAIRLPHAREFAPPRVGNTWQMGCASLPNDVVTFLMGLAPAAIALPPFGVLGIDPNQPLWVLGTATVADVRVDPIAQVEVPLPPSPALAGLTMYVQAIVSTRRGEATVVKLTNTFASVMQP